MEILLRRFQKITYLNLFLALFSISWIIIDYYALSTLSNYLYVEGNDITFQKAMLWFSLIPIGLFHLFSFGVFYYSIRIISKKSSNEKTDEILVSETKN